jgi:predicted Zn finger-like uncharacterized protein
MKYITSCPACETQFLLTKEHLKAYKGKVQCGNCEHIFNAKNRLTEISDDIQSAAEYQASLSSESPETDANQAVSNQTTVSEEKPIGAVLSNVLEGVDLASTHIEPEPQIIAEAQTEVTEAYDTEQIDAPIVIEDLTTDVRFSKPKTKPNYWLLFLAGLLALLAGLQSVYAMRTQIAAERPQFKPLLMQACAALHCQISLPKNLDLLSIDDSDMQEEEAHENVIKFSSLLINNASYAQAYPNIELTLTATDDQPVLRRLVKPSEYLKANSDEAAGIAAREEVRVNLAINVKDLAVAGYRVLLVY